MKGLHRPKRIALGMLTLLSMALAVGWMYFQHIPAWYRPLWLTRAQAEAACDEAEQTFEIVSRKMVAGQPFSITLTTRQINEMLSAQQILWPAATAWLDPRFGAPCVDIEADRIKVGLRCRWGRIQSVLSVQLAAQVQDNQLVINVLSTHAGSLPVPASAVSRQYFRSQNAAGDAVPAATPSAAQAVDPLVAVIRQLLLESESITLADTLWWPNGDIPFQVSDISLKPDSVTIRLVPLVN